MPGEGTQIVLPTQFVLPSAPRQGVVINLPELRLYYYPADDPGRVITHPVSIGRQEWQTPLGRAEIIAKAEKPAWYPPESIRREHAEAGDFLPPRRASGARQSAGRSCDAAQHPGLPDPRDEQAVGAGACG